VRFFDLGLSLDRFYFLNLDDVCGVAGQDIPRYPHPIIPINRLIFKKARRQLHQKQKIIIIISPIQSLSNESNESYGV
jgi:hypothetical protein